MAELIIILVFILFIIFFISTYLLIYFIEKWEAYLEFIIDMVFSELYAKKLMAYVTSRELLNSNEPEFLELSQNFLKDIILMLGRLRYIYYILYGRENFREFLLYKFILKFHRDVTEETISQMTEDLKEQNKNEEGE